MRESIRKGHRFDILKRDFFTCQYCGRKPPVVVLHVDHILAVANGGKNTDDNLITSCSDCNLGKSDKPLESVKSPILFSVEDRAVRLKQLRDYQELLAEQARIKEEWVDQICGQWAVSDGQDANADEWLIPEDLESASRRFASMLPLQEILDAVSISFGRYPTANPEYRFKFFCGVCWKKIRASREKIQQS